jgi:hypothetical protein
MACEYIKVGVPCNQRMIDEHVLKAQQRLPDSGVETPEVPSSFAVELMRSCAANCGKICVDDTVVPCMVEEFNGVGLKLNNRPPESLDADEATLLDFLRTVDQQRYVAGMALGITV